MVSKGVGAALLVLAGVGGVIVATEAFAAGKALPDRRLEIKNVLFDEGAVFKFFEEVKLNVVGSDIGTATLYMQTKDFQTGAVVDLQIKEVNLREGPKESTFVQ